MNKKSIILIFSVLVLLSLSVVYVMGDLSTITTTIAGDGYDINAYTLNWITDAPTQINLTVISSGVQYENFTDNITFSLNSSNVTWDPIVPGAAAR